MPYLAGGKKKKGRAHNPASLDAIALVVNPSDPPSKKGTKSMARRKKKRRKKSTRKRTATKRRRKNPGMSTRRKYSNKRAARTVNKSRRRRRTYKKKTSRRRRRNVGGLGKISWKNITRMLPALGWTAVGWSLSGIIQAAVGDGRIAQLTKWGMLRGNPQRARAVVSGLTWIGLWFAIDKVDYLKKPQRKDNLLRGAGLRFLWDAINGWMPSTGYGKKVRTIFGLQRANLRGGQASIYGGRGPARTAYDPYTGQPRVVSAGYDDMGYGYDDMMDFDYDPMLGFHYENWQGASPSGLALQPHGHAVAQPLGFHYENWQGASPSGLALQPSAQAVASPLGLSAAHNPYRPAFRPAFR
jgi:hypothetical protein